MKGIYFNSMEIIAVSYTHLDVYKRQVLVNVYVNPKSVGYKKRSSLF